MSGMRRWGRRVWVQGLAALALATGLSGAGAQPLSLQSILRTPDFRGATLSPNGRYVAVVVPVENRANMAILDLETRQVVNRIAIPGYDVGMPRWVGNDRLVFSRSREGAAAAWRYNTGGLFMVSRDGSLQRRLVPTLAEQAQQGMPRLVSVDVVEQPLTEGTELVIGLDDRDRHSIDLYRVNVDTNDRKLLTRDRPPRATGWLLDRAGTPRVATSHPANTTDFVAWWRATPDGPWTELWRASRVSGDMMVPLHVESDGRHLLVASNAGRDTMAVYRYDTRTRERLALLAEHPRFDLGADASGELMGDAVYDPTREHIVGFRVDGERPTTVWIDDGHERLQKMLDGALPDFANTFERAAGAPVALVVSYADNRSFRWQVLDERTGSLSALFVASPWLDRGQLVPMTPFSYPTRDGLSVASFHVLPKRRKPGEKLPTVVLIHGGPWTQPIGWGQRSGLFQEAQMLAAQGFAVLLPNFRGTLGLGKTIYQSSRGQWGKRMQEDIEDAVDWAVAQGITDPARVCLSGASYGGYAALMGLAKTPDKYRCGISGSPVSDLLVQINSGWSDISRNDEARQFWVDMVGDPTRDADALAATSPARLAARIKAPVMLYGGIDDRRTPFEQMELMRAALRAQKNEPRWLAEYGEGHGFASIQNVLETYTQKFDFLRTNLRPDGPAKPPDPATADAAATPPK